MPDVIISAEARQYHKFFSQYKWTKEQVDNCEYWLTEQLDAIMEESRSNLDYFCDLDEHKLFKTILRLMGTKQEEETVLSPEELRDAWTRGGTTTRQR